MRSMRWLLHGPPMPTLMPTEPSRSVDQYKKTSDGWSHQLGVKIRVTEKENGIDVVALVRPSIVLLDIIRCLTRILKEKSVG
jgi:hypothetical protein